MAQDHVAILKDAHRAVGFTDRDCHGLGGTADRGGGPVPGAQPLRQGDVGGRRVQVLRRGLDRAIRRDQNRTVDLRDLLDRLANARRFQIPLAAAVAFHRVEAGRMAHAAHLGCVADDEQRADRFSLAPFAADLDRQVQHGLQRVERYARLELAQIANRQSAQVIAQIDQADRVDRVRLEPAV